jgi:hypothetical protein
VTLAERARDREAERARLEAERERRERELSRVVVLDPDAPIPENLNRAVETVVAARSVDAALEQFDRHAASSTASTADAPAPPDDRHPETRMKAAFAAYEEKNLQRLRDENPSLRLQQVKQMLWDEWQKSPENPLVQQRNAEQAARLNEKRAFKDAK